jgi:hypothetical protein
MSPPRVLLVAALVTGVACVAGLTGIDPAVAGPVTGPLSDIVFGNLGASGTTALTTTGHLIESPRPGEEPEELVSTSVAMAFVTGSQGPWQLGDRLRVGIGSPTNSPVPFAVIVEDNDGSPWEGNTVALYYLAEESLTTTGVYDFTRLFADPLEASSTYWLIVADDAFEASSFNWYDNEAGAFPEAQNGSGWTFVGTKISFDVGESWQDYNAGRTAAFSMTVVPEPSTYCMALAGLACGGYSLFRRRKRA